MTRTILILTLNEVMQLLRNEIAWCERNPDKALSAEYQKGFSNGLSQAARLIVEANEVVQGDSGTDVVPGPLPGYPDDIVFGKSIWDKREMSKDSYTFQPRGYHEGNPLLAGEEVYGTGDWGEEEWEDFTEAMEGRTHPLEIFTAIVDERDRQIRKWGFTPHDVGGWLLIMEAELNEAKEAWAKNKGDAEALMEILQVATVAVACMEERGVGNEAD